LALADISSLREMVDLLIPVWEEMDSSDELWQFVLIRLIRKLHLQSDDVDSWLFVRLKGINKITEKN
jgi:hypothetical protein